jgi:hypothetical protein
LDPSLLLLAPPVATGIALPVVGAQPGDISSGIQQFASNFSTQTAAVLTSIDGAVNDIIKVAYLTCLLVGVLLYYTHIGRRLGKDLIIGGVMLIVIAEFVIPVVSGLNL